MKPTAALNITPTPTIVVKVNDGFSDFVVKLLESITNLDAMLLFKLVGIWLVVVWGIFSLWVLFDALKRYKNPIIPLVWFLFVLPFNILGFLGYLFIRPTFTKEEEVYMKMDKLFLQYEAYKLTVCPVCKTVVPSSLHFCPKCGTSLVVKCEECGKFMPIDYKFCTNCGAELPKVEVKSAETKLEKREKAKLRPQKAAALQQAMPKKQIKVEREEKKPKLKLFGFGNLMLGIVKVVRFVIDSTIFALSLIVNYITYIALFPIKVLGSTFAEYKAVREKIAKARKSSGKQESTSALKKEKNKTAPSKKVKSRKRKSKAKVKKARKK